MPRRGIPPWARSRGAQLSAKSRRRLTLRRPPHAAHGNAIDTGVRIPTAEFPDGRIAVFGSFDAVEWTAEVAGYEQTLREALPPSIRREVWISGSVSQLARAELEERGWVVNAEVKGL